MQNPNGAGRSLRQRSNVPWRSLAAVLAVCALCSAAPALAATPPLEGVVNVNTAGIEELVLLPGVGNARAQAIVSLRDERGRFESVDELMEVRGIGERLLAELKPFVRLSGKTTARRGEESAAVDR